MLKTKALRVLKIFQNMIVALISLKIYEKATNRITHCEMIRRLYSYKSLLRFDSLRNGFDVYVFRFLVLLIFNCCSAVITSLFGQCL